MKCTIGNCCGVNIMHTNEKIRCYPLRRHLTPKQGLIFYSLTLFKEISIPVVGYLYQCRQLVNRYVARSYNRYSSCLWGAFHSVVQKLRFDNAQFCVYSRLDKSPFETILLLYDICYDIICCSYRSRAQCCHWTTNFSAVWVAIFSTEKSTQIVTQWSAVKKRLT